MSLQTPSRAIARDCVGNSISRRRQSRARAIAHSSPMKTILGVGAVGVDVLAELDDGVLPLPDAKVRATRALFTIGGNVANGLTTCARLGDRACVLLTALGDDARGGDVARELARDVRVLPVVKTRTTTGYTYIMIANGVNDGEKTRTCVHTPGSATLEGKDVDAKTLDEALRDVSLVYFDGRHIDGALVVAREAKRVKTRVLVEAERVRGNLTELLRLGNFIATSKSYPSSAYQEAGTTMDAMCAMFVDCREAKFMVTTLGARGAIGLERAEESSANAMSESLEDVARRLESSAAAAVSDQETMGRERMPGAPAESGVVNVCDSRGKNAFRANVVFAPAMKLAKGELVDTTGAGDAFIGALAHAYADEETFNLASAMRLGAYVAAMKCKSMGARAGLPRGEDVPKVLMANAASRRSTMAALVAGFATWTTTSYSANASEMNADELAALFDRAMRAPTYEEAEEAWTRAIEIAPKNSSALSAALSNRGTLRLQYSEWDAAVDDLQRAVDLDGDRPDALTLNNLGNAKGALNRWDEAMADFLEASRTENMRAIAQANYALAAFQTRRDDLAIATAKKLLRKDPEYLDMRALLSAMYWSIGDIDAAEGEWTYLCKSGRGFGAKTSAEDARGDDPASDIRYASTLLSQQFAQQFAELTGGVKEAGLDTPCRLYKTTDTVANRWPPRATAALDAFLRVQNYGEALDYDGLVKRFDFNF